jgi:hypothetical protein
LRKAGFGEGELCDNNGTMISFAATREERLKNNDPRLSMAERYPGEGDRAAAIAKAHSNRCATGSCWKKVPDCLSPNPISFFTSTRQAG